MRRGAGAGLLALALRSEHELLLLAIHDVHELR